MSIRLKIFLGFGIIVLIGAVQGLYLLYNKHLISVKVEHVFAQSMTAIENARGAWGDFRLAQDHFNKVMAMTTPYKSKASIIEYEKRYKKFSDALKILDETTSSPKSKALLAEAKKHADMWHEDALILLGTKPATSIPAPHKMVKIESVIASELDTLVDVTLKDANQLKTDIHNKIIDSNIVASIFIACAMLMGGALAFFIGLTIVKPLQRLQRTMSRAAKGEFDKEVSDIDRKDEIGQMAATIEVFRTNATERQQLRRENQEKQQAHRERQKAVEQLITEFRKEVTSSIQDVKTNTNQMEETARILSDTADETMGQARGAADASSEAGNNVQSVAEVTNELTESITEIARQATETTKIVQDATEATEASDAKIASLAEAARKIGDVISLIREIAEQTNLLALNATIESARAGEAGKGFAVVAAEVKELATQTGNATEGITAQIANIQEETNDAVETIRSIAQIIKDVNSNTHAIASAVEEQGASTSLIAENVQMASDGANDASKNIDGVSRSADETAQSANQMMAASQSVADQADNLEHVIDKFLNKVAAA